MKQLIIDLLASGLTQAQLGERVGLSQAQINRLKSGASREPGWAAGDRLMRLHAERCGPRALAS